MSTFYNDGTFVSYGTQPVLITGLAGTLLGTYVAESFNLTFSADKIQIRGGQNQPIGQVFVSGFANGSATLQCGKASTPVPHQGSRFGYGGHVWLLSEIGDTQTQGDIVKAQVTVDKLWN